MQENTNPKTGGLFHIPSLNGIRAIAVLVVFAGHGFTVPPQWPGHVGVTVFFFLSGFLITTLLRREFEKAGRIALSKFYLRRALRILPPAYLAIVAATIIGLMGTLPSTTSVLGVVAEFFNATNYYLVFFGRDGLPPETSMLWSLAVEEHFYLIFPAVFIALLRRRLTIKRIGFILLGASALAPIWRILLASQGASFYHLYTGTDTRFDGLLIGAAMALLWNPALRDDAPLGFKPAVVSRLLFPIAVVVFALSTIIPIFVIRLTVVDTLQYICMIPIFWHVITRPQSLSGKVLNSRLLNHLGVLSFSFYLFHRMVLALVERITDVDILTDGLSLVVTLVIAQVVWICVERPLSSVRKKIEVKIPEREGVKLGAP